MAFYGCTFSFDGIQSSRYDLMLYNTSEYESDETIVFSSGVSIIDDIVGERWKPYFYGVQKGEKLEFTIVFGLNIKRIEANKPLSRDEINNISTWLTGHNTYKWLHISQRDMERYDYRCMITGLTCITTGNVPWAFEATVICDSPYAYQRNVKHVVDVNGEKEYSFKNNSSVNGYMYPKITVTNNDDSGEAWSFSITNITDNGREFSISQIDASITAVDVINDRCMILNDRDLNLYGKSNLMFFRMMRGVNKLNIEGNCTVCISYDMPVNIGG